MKWSKGMNNWRERRDALVEEYLQRNNGDIVAAIQELKQAYNAIPVPVEASKLLDYLNAIDELEERLRVTI